MDPESEKLFNLLTALINECETMDEVRIHIKLNPLLSKLYNNSNYAKTTVETYIFDMFTAEKPTHMRGLPLKHYLTKHGPIA
ncbi:hypothetical protein THIOSC15_2930015 [uncultured Thiomicrorhabdus sp.]